MTAPISQITVYSNASVLGSTLVTVGTFPVDNSSQRSATLRGENCVKIYFKAGQSIAIPAFSFIEYDGQLFFLKETYRPVPKGNSYYEYNMKFVSFDNMLSKPQAYRKVVVDGETWNEPDIDVVGNLADIATIIKDSIIETAGRYEGVFADMLSKVELVNAEININSESKAFSYSGQKISQVLDAIANDYEIDYWFEQVGDTQNGITNMILHFAKCEILSGDLHVTDKTSPSNPFDKLHPTVSGGLDECTFSNEWSGVVQRITPFGSERNIKRGQAIANDMFVSFGKRLRLEYDHSCTIDGTTYQHAYAVKNEDGDLEPLYVDENGAVYVPGVTTGEETIEKYDDIYPRGHFRVTHVTQRGVDTQIYTVYAIPTVERDGQFVDLTDAEIDAMQADPTKKLFPIDIADGQTLSLHFETGYLNGREFEVANKTAKMTWNGSAYEVDPDNGHWVACFEINPEGDNNDSPQVPYGNLIPRGKFDGTTGYEGDMFAIFNMDMPAFYVEDAQNELAQKAYDEIVSILATRPEVKCKGNEVYFKNHSLFLGQRIFVKSDLFGQDNHGQPLEFISRVTNYSHPLSKPNNVDFRLCSSRVQGAISVMKGAIADQTNDIMGVGQTARSLSRRAFRDAQEMIGMLQAVVAEMMVVGVERNQFQFTMGIECLKATGSDGIMHFDGLKITAGELQHTQEPYIKDAWEGHYSLLSETTLKADHNGNAIDKSATDTYRNTPYYLYAVINSSTGQVSMELWADKKDGVSDESYLLLGILSSEFLDGNTSLRVFNRSNGFTQIAGGTITTEQLQDPTRQLIIDMSSNPPRIIAKRGAQIIGNITFISSEGTETNLATKIDDMDDDIADAMEAAEEAMDKANSLADDGIISGGTEKSTLKKEWQEIAGSNYDSTSTDGSYYKAKQQAAAYGVSTSTLESKFIALKTMLDAILANMNTDYVLAKGNTSWNTKDKFIAKWRDYYDAEIALLNAVSDVIDTREIGGENLLTWEEDHVATTQLLNIDHMSLVLNEREGTSRLWPVYGTFPAGKYVFSADLIELYNGSTKVDVQICLLLKASSYTAGNLIATIKAEKTTAVSDIQKAVKKFTLSEATTLYLYVGCPLGSTFNKVHVSRAMIQSGEKKTEYQTHVAYLAEAFENAARAGSTDVDGGLLMTSLLKLRNEAGNVTAGMSGLTGTAQDPENVLLWGGATYQQALNAALHDYFLSGTSGNLITTLLKKDGTGKIGCFRVVDKNTVKVMTGNNEIIITTNSIVGYISTFTTKTLSITDTFSVNNDDEHNEDISLGSLGTVPAGKFAINTPKLGIDFELSFRKGTSQMDFSQASLTVWYVELVLKSGGNDIATFRLIDAESNPIEPAVTVITPGSADGYTHKDVLAKEFNFTNDTSRSIGMYLRFNCAGSYHAATGGSASNSIYFYDNDTSTDKIKVREVKRVTVFGQDGMAVSIDSSATFYVYNNGTKLDVRASGLPNRDGAEAGGFYLSGESLCIKPS